MFHALRRHLPRLLATTMLLAATALPMKASAGPAAGAAPAGNNTAEAAAPKPQEEAKMTPMEVVVVGLLGIISIVSLSFIIERAIVLQAKRVIPPDVVIGQRHTKEPDQIPALRALCNQSDSTYGRLLGYAIDHLHLSRQENAEALQTRARQEITVLERRMVALEIFTGIAPLLGLVGTIFGLIVLFKGMGGAGEGHNTGLFAQGISIALNATLLGLVVAIPSLAGWSYFNKRIETLSVEMENLLDEFLRQQYRSR